MSGPAANHGPSSGRTHLLLVFYVIECLAGAGIGYGIYRRYPVLGMWSLISVVLILAPDQKDTMMLAQNRIKANLVGAAIGLALFSLHATNFAMVAGGLVLSILGCAWLKIQAATRTAAVAVVIVLLHEPGKFFWEVAAERAGGVVLGCLIGVAITFVFHRVVLRLDRDASQ